MNTKQLPAHFANINAALFNRDADQAERLLAQAESFISGLRGHARTVWGITLEGRKLDLASLKRGTW